MNKEKVKEKVGYWFYHVLLWPMSLLPMPILYLISDFFFLVVGGIGYRRKVITNNLNRAFPEKTSQEIRKIRIQFYRHFCDLFVETIALQNISLSAMKKRVKVIHPEVIQNSIDQGRDVIAVLGHYCNWEWTPTASLHIENAQGVAVYRPLKNRAFDKFMIKIRGMFNSLNVPMKSIVRQIVKFKKEDQRFVLGLISDQSPSSFDLNYWTDFLSQNTPIIMGPEKIAKVAKADLVYWKMEKIKRGYYQVTFVPYPGNVLTDKEFSATEWHVRQLEAQIKEKPQYWLWSHKRWKYQHLFNPKTMQRKEL